MYMYNNYVPDFVSLTMSCHFLWPSHYKSMGECWSFTHFHIYLSVWIGEIHNNWGCCWLSSYFVTDLKRWNATAVQFSQDVTMWDSHRCFASVKLHCISSLLLSDLTPVLSTSRNWEQDDLRGWSACWCPGSWLQKDVNSVALFTNWYSIVLYSLDIRLIGW